MGSNFSVVELIGMDILLAILMFLTGTSFGSFLNVLIMRTVEGEQWMRGRSRCDYCGMSIPWYDNIPLLSYILLRGRARCCGGLLSQQYPIVETMTGIFFVWWYLVGATFFRLVISPLSVLQPGYWLIIGLVFVGIFFADWYFGIIPDVLVISGIIVTLIYIFFLALSGAMTWEDVVASLLAGLGSYAFFLALYRGTGGRGMGYGDVKLAGLEGLVLGYPLVIVGVFSGFILGAVYGVGLILLGKRRFGETIPFGPFMIMGVGIALLWGELLVSLVWY